MQRVFITGATKGIGLGLAKHFVKNQHYQVVLGVRDVGKANELFKGDKNVEIVKYDLLDKEAPRHVAEYLKTHKEKLDLIVNNAGVNLANRPELDVKERAEITIQTNFLSIVDLMSMDFFEQCVNKNAVVVNVSSKIGDPSIVRDQDVKKKLMEANEVYQLVRIAKDYVKHRDAEKPVVTKTHPWPEYALSKLLLTLYSEVLGKEQTLVRKNIQVHSFCPGWIKTTLGGQQAPDPVEKAVERFEQLLKQATGVDPSRQGLLYESGKFRSVKK